MRVTGLLWRRLGASGQQITSVITSLILMIGMLLTWGDLMPNLFRREMPSLMLSILTAGLLYLAPAVPATLLAAAVLFLIIYHRLDLGLLLVIGWAPFFLFPVELYQFAFPMAELLLLITTAAWITRLSVEWSKRQRSAPAAPLRLPRLFLLDWGVMAWVITGIISLLWAERLRFAVTELRTIVIEPALFYLILRSIPADRRTLLRLVDTLIASAVLVSLIGLFLYVRGEAIITAEEGARRLASVYGSPNNVGLLVGRSIPFALAFLLMPLDARRRTAAGAALLIMLAAAALTQSAGALFIGIPAGIAAVMLVVWRRRAWIALGGMAALGAVALPFLLQFERFARVFDFSQGTNFFRIRVWQSAITMIQDHPITGLGLDQFLYAFRGRYILPDAWQEPDLSHPHNIVLDFWVRLGLAGTVVLIVLQLGFWRAIRDLLARFKQELLMRAVVVGMLGSMVNLLSHGWIDNSVFVNDLALIFMLLLGLAGQLKNIGAIDDDVLPMV